jgi:ADP-ribose pyrophosphatase YjhB (NUDIX family)
MAVHRLPVHDRAQDVRTILISYDESGYRFLVQKRSEHVSIGRSELSFPGGGNDRSESYWEACKRDLQEESGLLSDNLRFLGYFEHVKERVSSMFVEFVAECKDIPGPEGKIEREVDVRFGQNGHKWMSFDDIRTDSNEKGHYIRIAMRTLYKWSKENDRALDRVLQDKIDEFTKEYKADCIRTSSDQLLARELHPPRMATGSRADRADSWRR